MRNIKVKESDFNCSKVLHCLLNWGDEGTEPDYLALGSGDYADDDIAYYVADLNELRDLLDCSKHDHDFHIVGILGIEEA